jgi:phosphoribosylglycinamide formyltransferase 2
MVTLAGTQNLSEFELHCRAVLGLPIPEITQEKIGASAVILSEIETDKPDYTGIESVTENTNTYLRIFGKPVAHVGRRIGVVVCYDKIGADLNALRDKCKAAAAKVKVVKG